MFLRVISNRSWRPRSQTFASSPRFRRQYAARGTKSRYWNSERLATTEKYPLSKEVFEAVDPAFESLPAGRRVRTESVRLRPQIVSPSLCDDVLAYYGRNLDKHKGCDILDLNPGNGLWSSKIHNYLKPRSHILLEPQVDKYERFLKPLVDKPNSNYKLAAGDPTRFETFEQLIQDGYFPHQRAPGLNDARIKEPNDTLLVIGSIAWEPVMPGLNFDSMSKQLFSKYTILSWQNEIFHAFGPARMLFWFLSDDVKQILPRSMLHAAKTSFTMQKFSHITEVVGPGHGERKSGRDGLGREPCYEIESLGRAMKTMKENDIVLPSNRREPIHDLAEDILEKTKGSAIQSIVETSEYLRKQLLKGTSVVGLVTEKAAESWKWAATIDESILSSGVPKKSRRPNNTTKEAKAASRIRASMKGTESKREAKDVAVGVGEDVYHLECTILGMEEGKAKESSLDKLQELQSQFDQAVKSVDSIYQAAVLTDLDDRLSLRSGIPRIYWDARSLEPLVMQTDEAWPSNNMSLADIQPLPIARGNSGDDAEYFQDFLYGLFFSMGADLPSALERLQPGASALIDEVPILRDPSKGGRLNMDQLRVRMLTVEMVDALCSAYRDWPFKNPEADHANYFRSKIGRMGRVKS